VVAPKTVDKCRLCGRVGALSFEHVPPRVTFNDSTVIEKDFLSYMGPKGRDWAEPPDGRGRQMQRGNGGRWLCRDCNSFLGREYVPHYATLVRGLVGGKRSSDGVVEVRACVKRFLKQVAAMFVAINGGGPDWPAFARFVREPSQHALPSGYRFFMFHCWGPSIHLYGFQHQITGIGRGPTKLLTVSEITHPPMGFHLVHDHSGEHDSRMLEITDWARYGLDDLCTVAARLVGLPVFSPMFNDFRTPDEMRRGAAQAEARVRLRERGWWLPGQ
jgi:hypothetical protein